jgi:diguanylate cyclase (GGDEF)-like protein
MGALEELTSLLEEVQRREGSLTPSGVGQALLESKLDREWPPPGEEREALRAHINLLTRQKRSLKRRLREVGEQQRVHQEVLQRALDAVLRILRSRGPTPFLEEAARLRRLLQVGAGHFQLEQAAGKVEELARSGAAAPAPGTHPAADEELWAARLKESYLEFLAQFPSKGRVGDGDGLARLRRRVEAAGGVEELLELRPEINRVVKSYAAGLDRERRQAADFILDMGSRLELIENTLGRSADHNQAFHDANEDFRSDMSTELKGLLNSVAAGDHGLEELKQEVLVRFNAIRGAIEEKSRKDQQRLQQATTSLEELQDQVQGVQNQVSRVKEENKVLQERLERDSLTGLANRYAYDRRSARLFADFRAAGGEHALLVIDVDHFKKINDNYGHDVGDRVLQALGEQFRKLMRSGDFIARYGGEEFTAILPDTGLEGAAVAAEKLRAKIAEERFLYRKRRVPVTVSIGFTPLLPTDESMEQVFKRADRALYRAKQGGRNRVERAPE